MTNVNENWIRINTIIKWAGMSANYFAHHIGLSCGENLYQIKRGNNGISRDVAERIVEKFPDISKAWLLTGEGSMFASSATVAFQIPFYNMDVESALSGDGELPEEPLYRMFVPQVGECDFAMVYNGKAMGRLIPAGTIVFLRKIELDAIIPGDEYVVVGEKFTTLRKVRRPKKAPQLTLVAGNRRDFDDILLDVEDVKSLYRVVGKMTVNN